MNFGEQVQIEYQDWRICGENANVYNTVRRTIRELIHGVQYSMVSPKNLKTRQSVDIIALGEVDPDVNREQQTQSY